MSLGVTHFAVGATFTTLLVTLVVPNVTYPRVWILVGGGWGMIPDIGQVYSHSVAWAFHGSQWADIFWFHRTLDVVDVSDSASVGAVAIAALIFATALAEHRSYRALGAVRNRGEPSSDD
ncbi:hypothetical protein [Natronomonas gomsonensis]|uniref:hypothetical protein n=1 Tax=Natronomonas gomsonensis TaxID=1046043 RepID=UPI0015BE0F17|nr:hypothetical protein [Natronomonas gomsonensis]